MSHNAAWALLLAVTLVARPTPATAASAEEVVAAIGITHPELGKFSLELGSQDMLDTLDEYGPFKIDDAPAAFLYSGDVGNLGDCVDDDMADGGENGDTVELLVHATAPADAHSFYFQFVFLTREYPEYVGSQFVDAVEVELRSKLFNGNLLLDAKGAPIDVNSPLITLTHEDLAGTGFNGCDGSERGGATEWFTVMAPCEPSEPLQLTFRVGDIFDGTHDSAALIDGFTWSEDQVEEPWLFPSGLDEDGDGFVVLDDCDDQDPAVNPDAIEVCDNGIDDDCDELVDDEDPDCAAGDDDGADDDSAADDDASDDDASADDDADGDGDGVIPQGDCSCTGSAQLDFVLPLLPLLAAFGLRRRLRVQ
jgi:Putative metal-binding motif